MGQELRDGIRRRMPSEAWQARGYESQSHHQEYRRDVRWFQARRATQPEAAAILEPIIRAVKRMRDHKPENHKKDFDPSHPSRPDVLSQLDGSIGLPFVRWNHTTARTATPLRLATVAMRSSRASIPAQFPGQRRRRQLLMRPQTIRDSRQKKEYPYATRGTSDVRLRAAGPH
jgi:hypothetical protein